ncbi:hypothetical protein N7468_001396 [Penicillium chermesinum]|uniref:DNA-directed RNA polymerase III subunit Rpc5 n=1 Tax=Penicillium chermesinum TaxID=63820 RepID=A0A9W9TXB0_9EURO|nr:uncharacterized protein N7468_001396 [Penicillium chermesinum]KAJ5246413.1 hypothetical protein N7468_001396 [Penicillium chermesinum]
MESTEDDPVIASYDVFLTDSDVSRYVFQYIDRPQELPYNASHGQKPSVLRLKPETGVVEMEVPINTHAGYDTSAGLRFGEAMKKSRSARENAFGMAGGFSAGSLANNPNGSRVKGEAADVEIFDNKKMVDPSSLIRTQALSGRIKPPEEGDPVHMLATIKGQNIHLSPVTAVVQLQPYNHHIDAMDELPKARGGKAKKEEDVPEPEARAVDVKVKGADDQKKWRTFDWVDAETEESWYTYENQMINQKPEELPQLESAINSEAYLDGMSAPRIDPARPDLTGWAMKQNRQKQRDGPAESDDEL